MTQLTSLQKTARAYGIQTSYIDGAGQEQFASDETLQLLLERLGGNEREPDKAADPVVIAWQRSKRAIKTLVGSRPKRIELLLEGETTSTAIRNFRIRPRASGQLELELRIPDLPTGYHELCYRFNGREERALLISAPRQLYTESDRQWGIFMPLYSAHSGESWGAGNLSDWSRLAEWTGRCGGAVVGSLPIMASFLEHPRCEPSPYSPASRLFWNEFFVDVTAVPEFVASKGAQRLTKSARFQRTLTRFREAKFIDYPAEWAARREVLELMADEFFDSVGARRRQFLEYVRGRPEVNDYARFRASCDHYQSAWQTWPTCARNGKLQRSDSTERTANFYRYIQWVAQEQVDRAVALCKQAGVKFYLDLPLGVNPDGFDAWKYRDLFARQVSAGAPPDAFFTKGQDWGFAPLDPERIRQQKYSYVIEYLRFQMRHTGLLRIDHVMGLHRLWWVPHGHPASAGAYVRYRADEWYAILSVESHRHKTGLVGENLGTVPPEVNESMDRHGLRRMYVLQYEQPLKGRLRNPESQVVASINTHDMPMFAAYWKGLDIIDRAELGLIEKVAIRSNKRERAEMKRNLERFLRKQKVLHRGASDLQSALDGVLAFLAQSAAETVLVTLEDLWGEVRSQNVPGTSAERPNWRRKSERSLEKIFADTKLANRLRSIFSAYRPNPSQH